MLEPSKLQYYLDTNAVQSLSSKLDMVMDSDGLYTSIWTEIELLSAIKNDTLFKKKKAAIKHLIDSSVWIDEIPSIYKILLAFGIAIPIDPIFDHIDEVVSLVLKANSFDEFLSFISENNLSEVWSFIKTLDELGANNFNNMLKLKFEPRTPKENTKLYDEKWKHDKDELLLGEIKYYANIYAKRYSLNADFLVHNYDHSVDVYMLVHDRFVGSKVTTHNNSSRNDFNDLIHLLYVKNDCKLVTDDKQFAKYVNEVFFGKAIPVQKLWNIILEKNGQ